MHKLVLELKFVTQQETIDVLNQKHGGILAVGEESANGSTYPGMFHVHTSPTKLQFIAQDSSGLASVIKTATTPTVNQWVHILISAQSGVTNGTNIYLNGSLDKYSDEGASRWTNEINILAANDVIPPCSSIADNFWMFPISLWTTY